MTAEAAPVMVLVPTVTTGEEPGEPLADALAQNLTRVVVETNLHLPGMFELTFTGVSDADLDEAGIQIGLPVQVAAPGQDSDAPVLLISGEITAIEGVYEDYTGVTTVRGYDLSHRLQRVRRTRAFFNTSDSKAAEQIAADAGLEVGGITPSDLIHDHLPQYDQTDWEFLKQRAAEIGYEFSMSDGTFRFRPASSVDSAGEPVRLTLHEELLSFAPRVTAGNLTPDVEVRVWDPLQAEVSSGTAEATTGSASAAGEQGSEEIAAVFSDPADDDEEDLSEDDELLGPPPSGTAFVVYDRPVGSGPTAESAADTVAGGLAEHIASTFAEAEGDAVGTPSIQAGSVVSIAGIPSQFPQNWAVTRACHIFGVADGGYHTEFAATGRHDRSLLGLTSVGRTQAPLPRIPGVVCGVVTNVKDEEERGRVKVTLPWLSPDYESDWAPVVQIGAGESTGAMFLPQVNDEVLVGFEFGDPRRAYVLGGIFNNQSSYSLGDEIISPADGSVVRRGLVTPTGNVLAFHDDLAGEPPASQIVLGTPNGNTGLSIDVLEGSVVISCAPDKPGQLTIKCGNGGTVNIQAGEGGTMTIDGGSNLTVKAQASMSIQCSGDLSVSGATISLGS